MKPLDTQMNLDASRIVRCRLEVLISSWRGARGF